MHFKISFEYPTTKKISDGPLYVPHFSILNLKSTILLDIFKHTRDLLENEGEIKNEENQKVGEEKE